MIEHDQRTVRERPDDRVLACQTQQIKVQTG